MERRIKEDSSCYASKTQQEVFGIISRIDIVAENFFITGGTALSVFYLKHRVSEDLDLFSVEFQDLGAIDTTLKRVFKQDLSLIQSSPEFYSYLIKGIKVDLVFDPLSIIEDRPLAGLEVGKEFLVDVLDNISSNKLSAIASRLEAKDIIDFYFISNILWKESKKESFLACYDMAKKKEALLDDPAMAAYQIEELLNRVLVEKKKALPLMKRKLDWQSFEKELKFYIELIYHMHSW